MEKLIRKNPTFIDLFAGAGGMSEGFIRAGFEPIAHVEMDPGASNTLKTRSSYHYLKSNNQYATYLSYLKGEITRSNLYLKTPFELLDKVISLPIGTEFNELIQRKIDTYLGNQEVDLIIGGPPCQAYSLIGRARSSNGMKGDDRNYLYVHYANFLEKYKPKIFVFENVIGLKSAGSGVYLKNMEKLFLKKGYSIILFTVKATNFNVLQSRKRIIIIGIDKHSSLSVPDIENLKYFSGHKVKTLFSDLPEIQAGEGKDKFLKYKSKPNDYLLQNNIRNGHDILTQHLTRRHTDYDLEIYRIAVNLWNSEQKRLNYNDLPEYLKKHHNRKSFLDRFKVVAENLTYSQTIAAHIAKDGHYYIHPDIRQNRSLSVREAARLQSFPDDYYFEGIKEGSSRTSAFKQIGNAVPPLMAYLIAKEIKLLL